MTRPNLPNPGKGRYFVLESEEDRRTEELGFQLHLYSKGNDLLDTQDVYGDGHPDDIAYAAQKLITRAKTDDEYTGEYRFDDEGNPIE